MAKGEKNYTEGSLAKMAPLMGVTVLQTSLTKKTPAEIYMLYKKRWTIETYYNYFKSQANYSSFIFISNILEYFTKSCGNRIIDDTPSILDHKNQMIMKCEYRMVVVEQFH